MSAHDHAIGEDALDWFTASFGPEWFDRYYEHGWDRIPLDTLDELAHVRTGDAVVSAAGFRVGSVAGVVVDGEGVTHLALEPAHAFGARDLAIPIGRIRVEPGRVRVLLCRDAIAALPAVTLRALAAAVRNTVPGERGRRCVVRRPTARDQMARDDELVVTD